MKVLIYQHKDILAAVAHWLIIQNESGPIPLKLYSHLANAKMWLNQHTELKPSVDIPGYITFEDTPESIKRYCKRLCKFLEEVDPERGIDYDALGQNVGTMVVERNMQYAKEAKNSSLI